MAELVIPGITDRATLACLARATRKYTQYVKAVEDALSGRCPFCQVDPQYNQIIAENKSWMSWHCKPPEKNTAIHVLFVPKRHVTDSEDLFCDEILDIFGEQGLRREVRRMLGYTSRGMLMRDGDATLSAGTIQHLHIHDMVPNGTGRVESPFYKGAESEAESLDRAIVFEKIRCGVPIDELDINEHCLIERRMPEHEHDRK